LILSVLHRNGLFLNKTEILTGVVILYVFLINYKTALKDETSMFKIVIVGGILDQNYYRKKTGIQIEYKYAVRLATKQIPAVQSLS